MPRTPGRRRAVPAARLAWLAWLVCLLPVALAPAAAAPARKPAPARAAPPKVAPAAAPVAAPAAAAASAATEEAPAPATGLGARLQIGPGAAVLALAWSPDGRVLAFGSGRVIRLWDVPRGLDLGGFEGHDDLVLRLAFSPDGQRLASAGADLKLRIWDVAGAQEIATADNPVGAPASLAWSPDGRWLALGGPRDVALFNAALEEAPRRLVAPAGANAGVHGLQFSADARSLATLAAEGVRFWSVADGKLQRTVRPQGVERVLALAPDLQHVLRSDGRQLVLGILDEPQALAIAAVAGVQRAAFSPDGRGVAWVQRDRHAGVWTPGAGDPVLLAPEHAAPGDPFKAYSLAPDGQRLALSEDETVRLCDAQGRPQGRVAGPGRRIASVAYSRDGSALVLARVDGPAALVEADTGRVTLLREKAPGAAAAPAAAGATVASTGRLADFSPDGRTIATAHGGVLRLFGRATGNELATLGSVAARDLRYTDDGRWLLVLLEQGIQLWDAAARLLVQTVELGASAAANPALMLGAGGSTLWLWQAGAPGGLALQARPLGPKGLGAPRQVTLPAGPGAPAASARPAATLAADGRFVALQQAGQALIVELDSGRVRHTLAEVPAQATLAFAPDGQSLLAWGAGTGGDRILRWDLASGQPLAALEGHSGTVRSLSVAADGRHIASAGDDRVLRIWNTRDGSLAAGVATLDDGGWAVASGDGWYDLSGPAAEAALVVRTGSGGFDVVPAATQRVRHRPDLVRRALSAANLKSGDRR